MPRISVNEQRDMLMDLVSAIGTEEVPLYESMGRVLAFDLTAGSDVPPFDRSPLDGYAFRSADVSEAALENPVTLKVLEEIPAGGVAHFPVTEGTAVRLMTGAILPEGADCVMRYESTEFTEREVKIFQPTKPGENVIYKGEDAKKGSVLAKKGTVIDPGLAAVLAGQNVARPLVYKKPKVGIITTGSELTEVGQDLEEGMIYDSNRYYVAGVLRRFGCEPVSYGIVGDDPDYISSILSKAIEECDAVVMTGGVSVGDFDYTPASQEKAGVRILFRGAKLKPGMACCYGEKNGKLVCGLSGNPSSSIMNFRVLATPAFLKMCGKKDYLPKEITVTVSGEFKKKSQGDRILHGKLDLSDGTVRMILPSNQGNVIVSSTVGENVYAVVPGGSGPVKNGTVLKAFLI